MDNIPAPPAEPTFKPDDPMYKNIPEVNAPSVPTNASAPGAPAQPGFKPEEPVLKNVPTPPKTT